MDIKRIALLCLLPLLASCTYNPFTSNNNETGSIVSTGVGAGIGAGGMALLGGSKPAIGLAGIAGGLVGYYVSTLRFDSGGVMQAGGQVYKIGEFVGIYIPSDKLFSPNTADLLPTAGPILDSAAAILERYPNNNILISGNTSGFDRPRREQKLSERRAAAVSAYFWNQDISPFKTSGMSVRKLNYVGYGDYFPLSSNETNKGLRQNSRVQITSYPSTVDLNLDKRHLAIHNIGAMDDSEVNNAPNSSECGGSADGSGCFKDN
jgi:outer membrane protein OmpA-like peptidoglycan-associated protein